MSERELRKPPGIPDPEKTRTRILMESAKMFAVSGYAAISIRDIAKAIGINPASIYAHYISKQEILDSIMLVCEEEIRIYYEMIDRVSWQAKSFPELLRNLFVESAEMVNPFAYYALYCASTNQFESELCRRLYYDIYFMEGHQVMCRQLEIAIERGLVAPFPVKEIGSLVTNCILNMVSISVGRLNGFYQEFDLMEWYNRTLGHILRATGFEPEKI